MTNGIAFSHPGDQGSLSGFLSWWIDGLSACVIALKPQRPDWNVLLLKDAEGIAVYSKTADGIVQAGRVSNTNLEEPGPVRNAPSVHGVQKKRTVVLRLAKDQVLVRDMQIPKGASDVIGPIVRNQLERIVPWPAPALCFGYEVKAGEEDAENIGIKAVATSEKILNQALKQTRNIGYEPKRIEFAERATASEGIAFIGIGNDGHREMAQRVKSLMISLLVFSLLLGAGGVFRLIYLGPELRAQKEEISNARLSLADVNRLQTENSVLVRQRTRVIEKRRQEPAIVLSLEALTKVLPDTSYLQKLEIEGRQVRMSGLSPDAASLIVLLEASQNFSQVQFSAPTTRAPNKTAETFSISATLRPGARQRAGK